MRQIFYIEADEEIISVIDRLRVSRADENVFVFPQGALVLRSIVNLYLFDREAKKRGRNVSIVTQDEMGRSMAEKVGIPVQAQLEKGKDDISAGTLIQQEARQQWVYPQKHTDPSSAPVSSKSIGTEDFFGAKSQPAIEYQPEPLALEQPERSSQSALYEDFSMPRQTLPPSLSSGSESFYAANPSVESNPTPKPMMHTDGVRRVVVKDRSPHYLTSLNSKREETVSPPEKVDVQNVQLGIQPTSPALFSNDTIKEREKLSLSQSSFSVPPISLDHPEIKFTPSPVPSKPAVSTDTSKSVTNFFTQPERTVSSPAESVNRSQPKSAVLGIPADAPSQSSPKKTGKWLLFSLLGLVVLGLGIGVWVVLPRADIVLTLRTTTAETDARFEAGTANIQSANQTQQLSTRVLESEKTITKSFPATGSGASADARVHGMVTISNSYSSDPQTLIATTRLVAAEGKLFRLKDTITVPGMHGDQPGVIEAEVIADQTGSEYAIAPSTFTIPGFSGTPKQGKFSVSSKAAFGGGGRGTGTLASVSSADVVKAKQTVEKEMRDSLETEFHQKLNSGENFLPETIEITTVSASSSPLVGVATDTFDYTWQVKARVLTFSEESVRAMLKDQFLAKAQTSSQTTLNPDKMTLEYGQPEADISKGILRFSVHARATLQPAMNLETLKSEFLGKSSKELEGIVAKHPEIASAEVDFGRMPFWQSIPSRSAQVTITFKYLGASE